MKPLAFTEEESVSQSQIEVLVVGSGFGGSVAAARIAEAGARVVLLERGPW
ncbi:MAG: NAD(P)-binding protein [Reyranella sp.]|jgi:cholesterol oxidase|nr:NAD(P)-binding protein [Reyranella sp.]